MARQELIYDKSKGQEFRLTCGTCKTETYHKVLSSVDDDWSEDWEIDGEVYEQVIWWYTIHQTIQCQGCKTVLFRKETQHSEWQGDKELGIPDQWEIEIFPNPNELDDFQLLHSRRMFDRDIVERVDEAKRANAPLALIMIDPDHFKRINDKDGHQEGDKVLKEVFQIAKNRVAGKGRVYRYGGDEIATLLPTYSLEEGAVLAESIRKEISVSSVGKQHGLTASFGVACVPDQASDWQTLIKCADDALYDAKNAGRNCVRVSQQLSE